MWPVTKSRFLWSQIITIDKEYVIKKLWVLEKDYYSKLQEAIFISLDLDNQY